MAATADDGAATLVRGFPVSAGWPLAAKPCDSCKAEAALLFCRADSAFLCMKCDGKVHGANKLAFRHERVWMCEVCEQAPAAVTCKADAATLCVSCDADIHSANPLASRHERIPVVPFFEPAASAARHYASSGLLLPNLSSDAEVDTLTGLLPNPSSKLIEAPELRSGDFFFSDVDPYLDLHYTPPIDARFGFHNSTTTDSLVPVQTKIPASSLPLLTPSSSEPVISFADYPRPKPCYSFNTTTPSLSHSVSSSSMDVSVVPDGTEGIGSAVAAAAVQLTGMDREARVLRYREKRKNRKFEKTIRYASRKAYAETRPRVKGRFAKRPTEVEAEIDQIYSSAAALMAEDAGYGVVPSF